MKSLGFANIGTSELKGISKEIKGKDLKDVLESHHFTIRFSEDFLQLVKLNWATLGTWRSVVSAGVLYMWVAWMLSESDSIDELVVALGMVAKEGGPEGVMASQATFYAIRDYLAADSVEVGATTLDWFRALFDMDVVYPVEYFQLLAKVMLVVSKDPNLEELTMQLCCFISILCEEKSKSFTEEVTDILVEPLMLRISRLDVAALSTYSHLAKFMSNDNNMKVISVFSNAISRHVMDQMPFLILPASPNRDVVELPPPMTSEAVLRFWPKCTFVNGLNLEKAVAFPEILKIDELMGSSTGNRLLLVLPVIENSETLAHIIFDAISATLQGDNAYDYYWDLIVVYLDVCSHCATAVRKQDIDLLCREPIFDPKVTMDDKYGEFVKLNTFRDLVVKVALQSGMAGRVLQPWVRYPALFSEIVQRFSKNIELLVLNEQTVSDFCRSLMTCALFYQHAHYQDPVLNVEAVEVARTSMFLLISRLFSSFERMCLLFANGYFLSFFLSSVFEQPLRSFVLQNLLTYLSKSPDPLPVELSSMLERIMLICTASFPDNEFLQLATDLLSLSNEALIHNHAMKESFGQFCPMLFGSFENLTEPEATVQEYVLECIQLFSLAATTKSLGSAEVALLDSCLERTFLCVTPQLRVKLIQLIAGDCLPSVMPSFTIRHPRILKMFLRRSISDPNAIETIDFILQLVSFSSVNAVTCMDSEFDLLLLMLIKDQENETILVALLRLFETIAIKASSVAVVQRYISLFSPVNGEHLPKFEELYLNTMNNIISATSKFPVGSMPMTYQTGFAEVTGLNVTDIEKGFTLLFWVYQEATSAQYKSCPFEICDQKSNRTIIFISGQSLFVVQKSADYISTGKVEGKLPVDKWTLVALTFALTQDNTLSFTPFIDAEQCKTQEFVSLRLQSGPVTFKIAGVTHDSIQSDRVAKMASFGCFQPLSSCEITAILDLGPRLSRYLPVKPIFFFATDVVSGRLFLRPIHDSEHIEIKKLNPDGIPVLNFTEVLITFCKIETILPLMGQIDMTDTDGHAFPGLLKKTIDLFGQLFACSYQAQTSFLHACGFKIIYHLLMQASDVHITYSLYQQFYQLMGGIKNESLQESLVMDILLKIDIWIRADSKNHALIIRHWDRSLFPTVLTLVRGQFSYILYILRSYYYYRATAEDVDFIHTDRVRGQEMNVSEIRGHLSHIALTLAMESFTVSDYNCLMSHCVTSTDLEQVKDLLVLLRQMIMVPVTPLQSIAAEIDLISPLYTLISRPSATIISSICQIVVDFYQTGLMSQPSLAEQTMYLLQQFSLSIVSDEFFFELTDMMVDGTLELFPMWCWCAATGKISEENVILALEQLTPSPRFCTDCIWPLWPIWLLSQKKSFDLSVRLLSFISEFDYSQWKLIYFVIHNMGMVLNSDLQEMKTVFIYSISRILEVDESAREYAREFVSIAKVHLFMRADTQKNQCLEALIRKSPFAGQSTQKITSFEHFPVLPPETRPRPSRPQKTTFIGSMVVKAVNSLTKIRKAEDDNDSPRKGGAHRKVTSLLEFREKLLSYKPTTGGYHFGVRYAADGKWMDLEVAESILPILELCFDERFLDFDLLLSSVLIHYNEKLVLEHLIQMRPLWNDDNRKKLASFISLVFHHATLVDADILVMQSVFGNDPHTQYLTRQDVWIEPELISWIKQVLRHLQGFMSSATENVLSSLDIVPDEVIFSAQTQMAAEEERQSKQRLVGKQYWSQLWRRVAIDPAPWGANLGDTAHFKRDFAVCHFLCPFKLKRNWEFDDHGQESPESDAIFEKVTKKGMGNNPMHLLERTDSDPNLSQKASIGSIIRPLLNLPMVLHNPVMSREGLFLISGSEIQLQMSDGKRKVIPLSDVVHVLFRTICHLPNSIEIFTEMGKSYLIQFLRHNSLAVLKRMSLFVFPRIQLFQTTQFSNFFSQNMLTPLWIRNKISNFEYLMHLNLMSGRTFNDLAQYPIFPWIIRDFTSETLDLESNATFRDLRKPIGALNPQRLSELKERTREIGQDNGGNYLYSSSYSSMSMVANYLVRMEPFTTIHIRMQGGKVDCGSHVFSSIADTYESVTNASNDFRELIPEFFFCPEFLVNSNHFDLGSTSKGKIDDVVLPPWAKGSPSLFVYTMRKALECDAVSVALNYWIDLIWGVKQRGRLSVQENNTFRPELYDSVWSEPNMSEQRRAEVEAALTHVGQIPIQLFTSLHPKKHITGPGKLPFSHPFVVSNPKVTNAQIAKIEPADDWTVRVLVVDTSGLLMINLVDFSNKRPQQAGMTRWQSKPSIYNPNGLSMSGSVSDTSIQNATETEDVSGIGVRTSEKEIKHFADLCIDSLSRTNSSAYLQTPRIAVVSSVTNVLYAMDFNKGTYETLAPNVVGVDSDRDFVAVARTNAVVDIFRGDFSRPYLTIPSYGDSITCCCVSKAFSAAVIGTRDGSLLVSSLNKGSTVRVIDLHNARPLLVTITHGWGFIVAHAQRIRNGKLKNLVYVFNINGERLGKAKIDSSITCWTTWTSISGFDYMVYADSNGKLFSFEVFYCNPSDNLYRCRSPVITVRYSLKLSCVIVALNDGRVLFIPHSPAS